MTEGESVVVAILERSEKQKGSVVAIILREAQQTTERQGELDIWERKEILQHRDLPSQKKDMEKVIPCDGMFTPYPHWKG